MIEENKNKDKEKELNSEILKKELEELSSALEECQKQKDEFLAGWQRARADFLNYKKEEMERIEGFLKYAGEEFILKILPILDNFDLAARQTFPLENKSSQEKEKINQVIQGFLQIKNQLQGFLKNQGVEEIKTTGEKFDPNIHEAVEQGEESKLSSSPFVDAREVEAKGNQSGIIIEEIQKGYKINGRLLRPAKVKVVK